MSANSSSSASIAPRPMTAADKTAFRLPASLGALAARFGGEIAGDGAAAVRVRAVAALHCAGAGDLTFFDDSRFDGALARTRAAAVLLPPAHATATALPRWICDEPRAALVELLEAAYAPAPAKPGVAAGARVADGARVHESASIGANAVVEEDAEIAAAAVLAKRRRHRSRRTRRRAHGRRRERRRVRGRGRRRRLRFARRRGRGRRRLRLLSRRARSRAKSRKSAA